MKNSFKNLPLLVKIVFALGGSAAVARLGVILYHFIKSSKNWAEIKKKREYSKGKAEKKRKERRDIIQKLNLQEPRVQVQKALDSLTIRDIQLKLRNKEFTSVELVSALIGRTIQVGVKHNLISDVLFEEALIRAQECDLEREQALQTGKQLSFMHGIPISIKDHIYVKGTSSNWCHCYNLYPLKQEDAVLVKILKSEGAIPFVKSATPSNSSINTCSYLWGQASQPQFEKRNPGGSSGGQAGLIQARASLIGIGSDSGGSLKIPAAWCGIACFFPTSLRMPYGKHGGKLGSDNKNAKSIIKSTPGPLAKFTDDLALFLENTYSERAFQMSPSNIPFQYNSQAYLSNEDLRIGYFYDCDLFTICPSARRALDIAIQTLRNQGHELVQFDPGSVAIVLDLTYKLSALDQSKHAAQSLLTEPEGPSEVKAVIRNSLKSKSQILKKKQELEEKKDRLAQFVHPQTRGELHVEDQVACLDYVKYIRNRMAGLKDQVKVAEPIHVLICPTMPYPAPSLELGSATYLATAYTCIANLAQMPSGSVPVTRVAYGEDKWDPVNDGNQVEDTFSQDIRKAMHDSVGLPMGVQVLGSPFRDEMVLRVMKEIEVGAKFYDS